MAQYIDKDSVIEEIERRLEVLANTSSDDNREFAAIIGAQHYELMNLAKYINVLEVKDVNLEKAKRYDEALEIAKKNHVTAQDLCEDSQIGVECFKNTLESIFPELKGSEDERIRKELTEFLKSAAGGFLDTAIQCKTFGKWVAWLKKQIPIDEEKVLIGARKNIALSIMNFLDRNTLGMCLSSMECEDLEDAVVDSDWSKVYRYMKKKLEGRHLENYDEAEKEKANFVDDGFIKCFANFLDFKEGETYWLEYIGDDKYNVRSDNLIGKTYHITPCQLYTIFKRLTWLEKQDIFSKKDVDDAYLKGVTDTKNEMEKQYEANSQIRKDIASFILNYKGDIKDRAKWIDYLGIKVSFVKKKHRYIPEFSDQAENEDK